MKHLFKNFSFFLTLTAVLVINFFILVNQAEAKDQYLGVYEDGREAYVMTETIKWYEEYRNGYLDAQGYTCTVKAVYPNSNDVERISYKYMYGPQVDGLEKNGVFYGFRSEYLKRIKKMPNHPEKRLMDLLIDLYNQGYRGK